MEPEPVKVKVYGLFSVTKKKYIYQLLLTVLMAGGLLYAWRALPRFAPGKGPQEFEAIIWWIDRLPYAVMGILGLVTLEAILVFRAFARKEAAQRDELARQAADPPTPSESPGAEPAHPQAE